MTETSYRVDGTAVPARRAAGHRAAEGLAAEEEGGALRWGDDALSLDLRWSADAAPALTGVHAAGVDVELPRSVPLVEVVTAAHGHLPANDRLSHTVFGAEARYVSHAISDGPAHSVLTITIGHPDSGLEAELSLSRRPGSAAVRASVVVRNVGTTPVTLRAVPSLTLPLGTIADETGGWLLRHGRSDWLAEGRWETEELDRLLPDIGERFSGHEQRGEFSVVSTGTWSTGKRLPVGLAQGPGIAWMWQVEHNGAWRWEVGRDSAAAYLSLSGPTHADHNWLERLAPGEACASVPVAISLSADFEGAVDAMTAYRRAQRRTHPDAELLPIVFNDYMNTINGDPTEDKLLPLIDAAASAGAEVFCIDAGWYDDSGDWWDSVGAWEPSATRFPNGLGSVIDHIRGSGMIPGLWLEPEVVGVKSPLASVLPDEAFFSLGGERLVEHHRYHLDLRHPAATAHLDGVIDRLVADYGIGYFKLDYNINPGTGSDRDADSTGAALLAHNRAHLAWLDSILDRHPGLVLENCGSGAMRSDWSVMSRLQLQSTSDQQDPLRYPPIAAAAPLVVLPEQAANWAYPQPSMSDEQIAFTLATGLAGRFFLSGHLNRMSAQQLSLVAEAVATARSLKGHLRTARPFWPLGLPGWDAPWVCLGLESADDTTLLLWNRDPAIPTISIPTDAWLASPQAPLNTVFPHALAAWTIQWLGESGTIRIHNPTGSAGARLFRLTAPAVPTRN
jgi:alpha-galactosidase